MAEQDSDDVTLVCNTGEEFTVKREALEEQSDYFRCMFSSGMKETRSSQISLPVISQCGLCACVAFLEGHDLDNSLELTHLKEVLTAATYLQISTLLKDCIDQIVQKLSVSLIYEVKQIALDLSLPDLESAVDQYIRHNLQAFYKADGYRDLSEDDICRLLSHDDLHVSDETVVFDFAIAWIRKEQSHHKLSSEVICKVLQTIRFPLMALSQLTACEKILQQSGIDKYCGGKLLNGEAETEEQKEVSDEDPECSPSSSLPGLDYARRILNRGNKKIIHQIARTGENGETICVRSPVPCIVACGGFTRKESSTNRFQYLPVVALQKPPKSEVSKRTSMRRAARSTSAIKFTCRQSSRLLRGPCCEHCVVVVDNMLYILGGQTFYTNDGRYTTELAARYDPLHDQWDLIDSMLKPRSLFYAAHLDGFIYAVCGWTYVNTVTKTVERYNLVSGEWEYVAPLQIGLHEHAGCVYKSTLFVSGGYKGPQQGHLDQTWQYDTERDVWMQRAPMKHPRSYHAMGVAGDTIIVAGGVNYLGDDSFEDVMSCEVYNMETDEWTLITNCSVPRPASCMPYFMLEDKLYVFGGHSFARKSDHTWILVFDMKQCTWSELGEFEASGIRHFGAAIMDLPHAFVDGMEVTANAGCEISP